MKSLPSPFIPISPDAHPKPFYFLYDDVSTHLFSYYLYHIDIIRQIIRHFHPNFCRGGGVGDRDVTVQTVPCTLLHGIRANEVMVSGHLVSALFRSVLNMRYRRIAPLAEGDP